ncbi:uncharacterized protein BJ171DRAFT_490651 [Polychytrium aggregatum]|uniref:uncharacterized protein n=1 Tax=Polychytrium aggregatum TaxID=110093 RepID=UPI0022FDF1EF|nr:uncharacterized protein BJ171DRAFT_490651 [Polychytrium aggregatum]KAI9208211.1 hypothetical protein BJ171DRAFT_490651 [Polychytrium aggregatum]
MSLPSSSSISLGVAALGCSALATYYLFFGSPVTRKLHLGTRRLAASPKASASLHSSLFRAQSAVPSDSDHPNDLISLPSEVSGPSASSSPRPQPLNSPGNVADLSASIYNITNSVLLTSSWNFVVNQSIVVSPPMGPTGEHPFQLPPQISIDAPESSSPHEFQVSSGQLSPDEDSADPLIPATIPSSFDPAAGSPAHRVFEYLLDPVTFYSLKLSPEGAVIEKSYASFLTSVVDYVAHEVAAPPDEYQVGSDVKFMEGGKNEIYYTLVHHRPLKPDSNARHSAVGTLVLRTFYEETRDAKTVYVIQDKFTMLQSTLVAQYVISDELRLIEEDSAEVDTEFVIVDASLQIYGPTVPAWWMASVAPKQFQKRLDALQVKLDGLA